MKIVCYSNAKTEINFCQHTATLMILVYYKKREDLKQCNMMSILNKNETETVLSTTFVAA